MNYIIELKKILEQFTSDMLKGDVDECREHYKRKTCQKMDVFLLQMFLYYILALTSEVFLSTVSPRGCLRDIYPVIDICSNASLTSGAFLVEFTTFEVNSSPYCTCDITVHLAFYLQIDSMVDTSISNCGSKVSVGPFPRYDIWERREVPTYSEKQCKGTYIRKRRDELYQNHLTLNIEKLTFNYSSRICMRFQAEAWNGSMTIQCYDPMITQNISEITTVESTQTDSNQECYMEEAALSLGSLLFVVTIGLTVITYCYCKRRALIKAREPVYMGLMDVNQREKRKIITTLSDIYSEETSNTNQGSKSVVDQEAVYDEIYY